jgi:pyruvate formate lyase activating enzyme
MDAANVDLKAFSEDFYATRRRGAGAGAGHAEHIRTRRACWLEITTLLIPG